LGSRQNRPLHRNRHPRSKRHDSGLGILGRRKPGEPANDLSPALKGTLSLSEGKEMGRESACQLLDPPPSNQAGQEFRVREPDVRLMREAEVWSSSSWAVQNGGGCRWLHAGGMDAAAWAKATASGILACAPLLFLYYSSIIPLLFLYCSSIPGRTFRFWGCGDLADTGGKRQ